MEFLDSLQTYLFEQGFRRIKYSTKLLWVQERKNQLFLIEIIPELLRGQAGKPLPEYEKEIANIERRLMVKYQKKVRHLFLRICADIPEREEMEEAQHCYGIWFVNRTGAQLYVYENQPADYCGIRDSLESFLHMFRKEKKAEHKRELRRSFTPVNTILVAANLIVFGLLCTVGDTTDADFMAAHGAMTWQGIVEQKEYYRLFTSMFLHFGADHLLQNMLILMVMGCRLERIIGKVKYLIVYIGSGLISSLASLFFTLANEPNTVSAGASGAIFGVMGGVLFLILADVVQKKRNRVEEIGLTGILFMIGGALSYGFFSMGVDNAAHVGGVIGGFFLTAMLSFCQNLLRF